MALSTKSYGALVVAFAGFGLATVGAFQMPTWLLAVGMAVGGTLVMFGALLVSYYAFDDNPTWRVMPKDERTAQIEYRASRNAYAGVLALVSALLLAWPHTPWWPGPTIWVLLAVDGVAILAYAGSLHYYGRVM